MIAYCNFKGIGVISYAPLMTGLLARPIGEDTARSKALKGSPFEKKVRSSDEEIIRHVQKVSEDHKWSMSQVALAWSLSKVSSPIVGVNTVWSLLSVILRLL